jgi:hypothetical protein
MRWDQISEGDRMQSDALWACGHHSPFPAAIHQPKQAVQNYRKTLIDKYKTMTKEMISL